MSEGGGGGVAYGRYSNIFLGHKSQSHTMMWLVHTNLSDIEQLDKYGFLYANDCYSSLSTLWGNIAALGNVAL